ncbi:AAA family ATPase [Paenibacillus sp. GCM10023248]|uniref:AAA family ATPase n=1 Tax=Bacillales TaxID=1385 RepID=UPI00237848F4|nr:MULTISPECIES: AAA family ATPase [Bacillales]MDD9267840.1 AAA family ATPase [Paenibacillus sp. MAHUQ-63]MDR6882302.1 cellulose biosynthesis protein BcsQ [Bacillus sp. 3255]
MTKIQLYVLDDDEEYAQRLSAFIRSSEFAERFQVKLISQPERVMEQGLHADGVLLMSDAIDKQLLNWRTSLVKVALRETFKETYDAEERIPSVYRFQSLPNLLTRLEALYAAVTPSASSGALTKSRVITLYSACGSSGKTITAIHLAKQLSFRGERVFYLSLESVSGAALWLQGDKSRFSQLIYYMRSMPDFLGPKLQLLKSHDPLQRFDYLSPNDHMREMQDMNGEQTGLLIQTLQELRTYDYIIIDLDSSVHPRISKALELSDCIVWLVRDDLNDVFKTVALYEQIGTLRNVHFVMNKFTGIQENDWSKLGKEISYRLPYIPEWKSMSRAEQVWQSILFSEQTYEMFAAIMRGAVI